MRIIGREECVELPADASRDGDERDHGRDADRHAEDGERRANPPSREVAEGEHMKW